MYWFILCVLTAMAALMLVLRDRGRADGEGARRRVDYRRLALVPGVLAVVFLLLSVVRVVPPGNVAIPVTFGSAGGQLGPGLHFTSPFTILRTVSVRTEQYTMTAARGEGAKANRDDSVQVLGKDGGAARVDATLLYRVDPPSASRLYREVGATYADKVIRPSTRSCVRAAFTDYDMVVAATLSWIKVNDAITECVRGKLEPRGIDVQDFQLREVKLADTVQGAVDAKVAAQQDAERQRFELDKAQQQADIKRVEAHATADAQQILACGAQATTVERNGRRVQVVVPNPIERCAQAQLTPQYLQFTYIQALKELVNSPNNSTIILPFDQNLTPLIQVPQNTTATTSTTPTTAVSPSR